MTSQKTLPTKIRLSMPKKLTLMGNVSPGMPISTGFLADSKVSTIDKSEKTISPRPNQPAQFKDVSKIVSESSVEVNMQPDFNSSELSIIRMLEHENFKPLNENNVEMKLREEVNWLKKELEGKSSFIEKLMRENDSLRREMDELLTTVEDAKDKINLKLLECNKKIQQLENDNVGLKEESRQYQEQLQKARVNAGKYYTETQEKMDTFYNKVNNQVIELISSKMQGNQLNTMVQSQVVMETQPKETPLRIQIKHGSPNHLKPRFSTPKVGTILPQAKITRPAVTPNGNLGRSGAENHANRKKRMIGLQQLNDVVPVNYSENNCILGQVELSGIGRTPKVNFTPKSKIRLPFHTEGFDFGDENS